MSFNTDGKILEKIARLNSIDTSASLRSQGESRQMPGAQISFSDDDVKKLQKKREKDGWCVICGEVKTHKKVLMRMAPETVHGLVYRGVCLRCNPSPNLEGYRISYGNLRLGWERTVRASDFKFRWEHCQGESSNYCLTAAYVRKVEFFTGDSDGPRVGRVSLIAAEDSVFPSVVECADGRTLASYIDIQEVQKMNLERKKQWFYDACGRLCRENEGQARIKVRKNHLLEDSIKAVMAFNQADLRKTWVFEREEEFGEMSPATWYASVIGQMFSNAGFWQKCAKDETRMDINFLSGEHHQIVEKSCPYFSIRSQHPLCKPNGFGSDMVGLGHRGGDSKCVSDHLTLTVREYVSDHFRFLGRILAKALVDGHLVRCRLAKHLYMLILGWPIMLDDLQDLDAQYHSYLRSLVRMFLLPKYDTQRVAQEASVTTRGLRAGVSSLGLNFTVSEMNLSGLRDRIPLVPNGELIAVDDENILEYIDSCLRYRLFGRHEAQLTSFLLGFLEVVPEPLLAVFDYQELEILLCGSYTGGKTEGESEDSFSEHEISTISDGTAGNGHPVNAIVKLATRRVDSSSSQSVVPLPEALLIEDALYDAVAEPMETADNSGTLDANEIKYRLKKGRCGKCGMQTHKLTGVLKKRYCPLSNENVLNGRCLFCNPIKADVWENTERTYIGDFPHPPPSAPSFEPCASPIESVAKQQQKDGVVENPSEAKSQDEVEQWLLSRLPSLQKQDIEKYRECLVKDGFDSIAMMEHLEEEDLQFMKKGHKRALMKSL